MLSEEAPQVACLLCGNRYPAHSGALFHGVPGPDDVCCESCVPGICQACDACGEPIYPGPQLSDAITLVAGAGVFAVTHGVCAPSVILLCGWRAVDRYGGPEEGGWTYESRELLAAVPVLLRPLGAGALQPEGQALEAARRLVEQVMPRGHRERLVTTFELRVPASPQPAGRPQYE